MLIIYKVSADDGEFVTLYVVSDWMGERDYLTIIDGRDINASPLELVNESLVVIGTHSYPFNFSNSLNTIVEGFWYSANFFALSTANSLFSASTFFSSSDKTPFCILSRPSDISEHTYLTRFPISALDNATRTTVLYKG